MCISKKIASSRQRSTLDSFNTRSENRVSKSKDGLNDARDRDLEYYNMVAAASKKEKEKKKTARLALAAQDKADKMVKHEEIIEGNKRGITYTIQRNKGLTRTKRGGNNPRVKKRVQFAKKQTKLRSMKPVYNGGEGRGGYQGELTGIKTGLIKSIKL